MSQRVMGQESLGIGSAFRSGATLGPLSSLIDGQPITALLSPLDPSAEGEPAWPPLEMFRALLLAVCGAHPVSTGHPAQP